MLGLKSAKFVIASPPPPLTPTVDPPKGSELPNGSFGNPPKGSGFLGLDGLEAGDFPLGGAGLGGGAFFCFGGKAGRGDSGRFLAGCGINGSLPNKSPLDFWKKKENQKLFDACEIIVFTRDSIMSKNLYR